VSTMLKKCPKCKENKNRANFKPDGYCHLCSKAYHVARAAAVGRVCSVCDVEKPISAYSKKRGVRRCMVCAEESRIMRANSAVRNEHMQGFCSLMNSWLKKAWL
jgi:hypothetical protein